MNLIEHIREGARQKIEYREMWKTINRIADAAGAPHEFVTCDFCGAKEWRVPPHGFADPCPIAVTVLESLSTKVDAERMLAVRSGVHLEEMREMLDNLMPGREDADE